MTRFFFLIVFLAYSSIAKSQEFIFPVGSEERARIIHSDGQSYDDVSDIPHPKNLGQNFFVSNPNNILGHNTEIQLNKLLWNIDSVSGAEFAIVVVEDFQGDDIFEFSLSLFNTWGIGKKDNNSGLLLFIATNRRAYQFISGYGMESIFPDAALKRVGEKFLVPNFRNGDYDAGTLEAANFISKILVSPDSSKELARLLPETVSFWSIKSPILKDYIFIFGLFALLYVYTHWVTKRIGKHNTIKLSFFTSIFQGIGCMLVLLFISVFIFAFGFNNLEEVYTRKNLPYFVLILVSLILAMKITGGRERIKKDFLDAEQQDKAYRRYCAWLLLPMLITPLAWFDLINISSKLRKNKGRFIPPDLSGNWERIVRANLTADKGMLSQGQRNEERVQSRKYEIWRNTVYSKVITIPWEINNTYKQCPQCAFYTLEVSATKVIRPATYSSSGEGEKFDKCSNCSYRKDKGTFMIPKKVRSTSSDGRSSSSSSRGSSSSSSGSFGGGSSGGGGAGGRW